MADDRPRAYRHGLVFRQPRFETERITRPRNFQPFYEVIVKLYSEEKKSLQEVMEYMFQRYGFAATIKQYKTQLRKWEIKVNLNETDAAHLLRLLRHAERNSLPQVATFVNQRKTRRDITRYIQRHRTLRTEDDLLARIPQDEATPDYITLGETRLSRRQVARRQRTPVTPPSGGSTTPAVPKSGNEHVLPVSMFLLSPDPTPRTSLDLPAHQSDAVEDVPMADLNQVDEGLMPIDDHLDWIPDDGDDNLIVGVGRFIPATQMSDGIVDQIGPDAVGTVLRPILGMAPSVGLPSSIDIFNASMSSTPIILPEFNPHSFDVNHLGNNGMCPQLRDQTDSAWFLTHCIYRCICLSQDSDRFEGDAAYFLEAAVQNFRNMLQHSPGECFTTLSNLVTLFECYGQRAVAMDILKHLRRVTTGHRGADDPLTETIGFMTAIPTRDREGKPQHNLDNLEKICREASKVFPEDERPALTARFNLAWANLEMGHFHRARDMLVGLRFPCEQRFGANHMQTISCIATLARALLHCGQLDSAECLIREVVCVRVREIFPKDHPYLWEAMNRHAIFLLKLASADESQPQRDDYVQHAEILLREVVVNRYRVLGPTNERSTSSFRRLRDLLQQEGKDVDARDLIGLDPRSAHTHW